MNTTMIPLYIAAVGSRTPLWQLEALTYCVQSNRSLWELLQQLEEHEKLVAALKTLEFDLFQITIELNVDDFRAVHEVLGLFSRITAFDWNEGTDIIQAYLPTLGEPWKEEAWSLYQKLCRASSGDYNFALTFYERLAKFEEDFEETYLITTQSEKTD